MKLHADSKRNEFCTDSVSSMDAKRLSAFCAGADASEQQAARAGYPGLEAYIEALILRDRRQTENWLDELLEKTDEAERDRARQRMQERVVALLDEGVASGPATPMTADDWEAIRREVRERRVKRDGA